MAIMKAPIPEADYTVSRSCIMTVTKGMDKIVEFATSGVSNVANSLRSAGTGSVSLEARGKYSAKRERRQQEQSQSEHGGSSESEYIGSDKENKKRDVLQDASEEVMKVFEQANENIQKLINVYQEAFDDEKQNTADGEWIEFKSNILATGVHAIISIKNTEEFSFKNFKFEVKDAKKNESKEVKTLDKKECLELLTLADKLANVTDDYKKIVKKLDNFTTNVMKTADSAIKLVDNGGNTGSLTTYVNKVSSFVTRLVPMTPSWNVSIGKSIVSYVNSSVSNWENK